MAIHLLTPHFNVGEFYRTSQTDLVDDNKYAFESDQILLVRASHIAFILELIRTSVNQPLRISSGFRCNELNSRVGGVSNSDHLRMLAVDIHGSKELLYKIEHCCEFFLPKFFRYIEVNAKKGYIHLSFNDPITDSNLYNSVITYLS